MKIPDYSKVPVQYMSQGLKNYYELGIMPGHFLEALLSNNLMDAVSRADHENLENLHKWVTFMRNELDYNSYGSELNVSNWCLARFFEAME